MPFEVTLDFTCDNPLCDGANGHTPAIAESDSESNIPAGWIKFFGAQRVGATEFSGVAYFHHVACAQAWWENEVVPGLLAMGAAA